MKINHNSLIFGLFLLASPFLMQAQTTPVTCTNASLTGTHSLLLTGRDVLSTVVFSKSSQGVGTATFDGIGGVTFNLTTNTNSSASVTQKLTGTYSLPSNCLGTLTITGGDSASFTLIPYNQGKNFTITGQDATYAFTGGGGIAPTACLAATLSGAYTFTGSGYALTAGVISGVNTISGLLQFDGAGAITGNWSIANSTTITPVNVTGQYTVSPSCVASATVKDANGVSSTFYFTVTSADGANLSLLLANATTTFSGAAHSTFTNPGLAVELAAGAGLTVPPGSLFSIYGTGLSTGQGQAINFPLPTTLAKATVTVNGEQAPLYFVDQTDGLINAQMPLDIQPGIATVVVTNGTAVSNAVAVVIPATAQPGVFVYGNNHAAAQNFPSYSLNTSANHAKVGDTIVVYFTGGGPVLGASALGTGRQTPAQGFQVTEDVSATIAGVKANVTYAGLVPTSVGGFYQANIVVPTGVASGDRTLILTIGGKASNATVVSVD